jgi:hypothetical protein
MRDAVQAENIYNLIEELTDAVDTYLDGYFPEDFRRPMEDNDDALFREVYEPLMNIEALIRDVKLFRKWGVSNLPFEVTEE